MHTDGKFCGRTYDIITKRLVIATALAICILNISYFYYNYFWNGVNPWIQSDINTVSNDTILPTNFTAEKERESFNFSLYPSNYSLNGNASIGNRTQVVGFYNVYMGDQFKGLNARVLTEHSQQISHSYAFSQTNLMSITLIGPNKVIPEAVGVLQSAFNSTPNDYFHYQQGFEELTLTRLHDFCCGLNMTERSNTLVWYSHNKGSYSDFADGRNDKMRRNMTNHSLSQGCFEMITQKHGGVCGARIVPQPWQHYPGNFWIASCSHISKLPPPGLQRMKYNCVITKTGKYFCLDDFQAARGRYHSEHWIGVLPRSVSNYSDCMGYVENSDSTVRTYWGEFQFDETADIKQNCTFFKENVWEKVKARKFRPVTKFIIAHLRYVDDNAQIDREFLESVSNFSC